MGWCRTRSSRRCRGRAQAQAKPNEARIGRNCDAVRRMPDESALTMPAAPARVTARTPPIFHRAGRPSPMHQIGMDSAAPPWQRSAHFSRLDWHTRPERLARPAGKSVGIGTVGSQCQIVSGVWKKIVIPKESPQRRASGSQLRAMELACHGGSGTSRSCAWQGDDTGDPPGRPVSKGSTPRVPRDARRALLMSCRDERIRAPACAARERAWLLRSGHRELLGRSCFNSAICSIASKRRRMRRERGNVSRCGDFGLNVVASCREKLV